MPTAVDTFIQVTTAAAYAANEFSVGPGGGVTADATASAWYGKGTPPATGDGEAIPLRLHKILVNVAPASAATLLLKDIGRRGNGTPGTTFAKSFVINTTTTEIDFGDVGIPIQGGGIAWALSGGTGFLGRMVMSVDSHACQLR